MVVWGSRNTCKFFPSQSIFMDNRGRWRSLEMPMRAKEVAQHANELWQTNVPLVQKENRSNKKRKKKTQSYETNPNVVYFCCKYNKSLRKWAATYFVHQVWSFQKKCVCHFHDSSWKIGGTLGIPMERLGNLREDGHLFLRVPSPLGSPGDSATNPSIWWNSARCVALRKSHGPFWMGFFFPPENL